MIDKVEFIAKNLTSNAGVLLLLNYAEEQRIFQELDEMLVFDNKSTEEIKMNYLKALICECRCGKAGTVSFVESGSINKGLWY